MKIEARVVKRYCFQDQYAFVVMEAPGLRETVLFYIQGAGKDELVFVKRVEGCTLDDTDRHLKEIEALASQAVLKYSEVCKLPCKTVLSSSELPKQPEKKAADGPKKAAENVKQEQPIKPAPKKRFVSAEEEEREKRKSLAILQKNSLIDYRYNRKGEIIKQMAEGKEQALVSDVFSVIALVNRRMADDIRPILLSMLPYYHNSDFDMEYQMARDKETTIRYVVNGDGMMTACTVNGGKYPLCLAILMILRSLAEQSEEGMDAFHDRIMKQMNQDMQREKGR